MLTFGNAKQRLARYANAADISERINLACELLLTELNPKGSTERVAFVVSDGVLTLPRQYFGCLGTAVEQFPRPIYNHWYEFVGGGTGTTDVVYNSVVDLGDGFPTTIDLLTVNEDGSALRVVSELSEDNGQKILFRGLDASLDTVWTTLASERLEGEYVDLDTAGATSATTFSSVKSVIKPVTKGKVFVYAGTTLIATYEPGEERPVYRRYRVPKCGDRELNIVALCQRRHVDLRDDNDPVPIENVNALRDTMMALQYRDQNDDERYRSYLSSAVDLLSKEKRREQPASTYPPMVNMPGFCQIHSIY